MTTCPGALLDLQRAFDLPTGAADGASDGVQDKKVTLSEFVKYVIKTAKEASTDGYAEPQFAGEYVADEVLFSVP